MFVSSVLPLLCAALLAAQGGQAHSGDEIGQIPLSDGIPSHQNDVAACLDDLLVATSLFTIQGAVSPEKPNVRQFLGIPFAEPPIGKHRFRPPVSKAPTADVIDATRFGFRCFQHDTGAPSFYRENEGFNSPSYVTESEDCLTLDIWSRRYNYSAGLEADKNPKAAVMIWIHGGALMTGDSSERYMDGTRLVADHDDVIVVSINYRVSIFGFPRAEALDGRNLNPGFLDVRAGVEWVRNNIVHFGGDPNRMILFGNSAGSTQVDKYIYAWAHDPLVKGYIMMSGQGELSADPKDTTNFTFVAQKVGCSGEKDTVFDCMQKVHPEKIMEVLNKYNPAEHGGKILNFQPQADNQTSFSNYTDLQQRGLYSQLPQVIGNCDNEFASLYKPYTGDAPDQEIIDALSNGMFICPAAKAARARQQHKTPIWRYRYFGDFPNQNPLPWLRAYHASDVPMVFGTTDFLGENTAEQNIISKYMQKAFVAFAKDPANGLLELGWPLYVEEEETLVRIARENSVQVDFAPGNMYDTSCSATGGGEALLKAL